MTRSCRRRRWMLLAAPIVAAALLVAGVAWLPGRGAPPPADDGPATMLWAWERPEDLRFLDPGTTGVAYLAGTATLSGDTTIWRPRLQPLQVSDGTVIEAVVRVEVDPRAPPTLSDGQRARLAGTLAGAAGAPGVRGLQVDFDATASQRGFYRDLLADLRAALPGDAGLSMTALASWCLGDPWIADLPVDRAVPMLFEMGADDGAVRRHLADGGGFGPAVCQGSVGLATGEPAPDLPGTARTYWFHDTPWTAEALAAALESTP